VRWWVARPLALLAVPAALVGVIAPHDVATAHDRASATITTAESSYVPLSPARLMDTRTGSPTIDGQQSGGGPDGPNSTKNLHVAGRGGVPTTGAAAVVLNVSVTEPTAASFLTAYPHGETRPIASNLNYVAGQTIPNLVIVKLGSDGTVDLYNLTGTTHIIVDVEGWYPTGSSYTAVSPARLMDTRTGSPTIDGQQSGGGPDGPNSTKNLHVAGRGGVPATGAAAVVLNVSVTEPTAASFLTVFPHGETRPIASNLNYVAGQTIPNLVIVKLGSDGTVDLYNLTGTTHIIIDVEGWYPSVSSSPPTPTPTPDQFADGLSDVAHLASGQFSMCAVLHSGGVDCWGTGNLGAGQLHVTATRPTPVVGIGGTGKLGGVVDLAVPRDDDAFCALLTSGGVACWGNGGSGRLGNGSEADSAVPVAVKGVGGAGSLTGVAQLTPLTGGFCARLSSGGVDCWGANLAGDLGVGPTGPNACGSLAFQCSLAPTRVLGIGGVGFLGGVLDLRSNGSTVCARLISTEVACWGFSGQRGGLGNGTQGDSNVPTFVKGVGGVGTLSGVATLMHDDAGSCAVLSTGGIVCWGGNDIGELGNGTVGIFNYSVVPVPVHGIGGSGTLGGIVQASQMIETRCAIDGAGGVSCWGQNANGALGNNQPSLNIGSTPVTVVGIDGVGTLQGARELTPIIGTSQIGWCALLPAGGAACWGGGLLGTTALSSLVPRTIAGIGGVGTMTDISEIVNEGHGEVVCAIVHSGHVSCWGSNFHGTLGKGTVDSGSRYPSVVLAPA
jgi:hypothetical protein